MLKEKGTKHMITKKQFWDNFDEENIEDAIAYFEQEKEANISSPVYTLEQKNSPCKVTITEKSCKLCAELLTKV